MAPETPRLRDRLEELLVITRDTVTTDRSMLEAAEALGHEIDTTLAVGKQMVNRTLKYGWEAEEGGLYDGGLVVGPDSVFIARSSKEW